MKIQTPAMSNASPVRLAPPSRVEVSEALPRPDSWQLNTSDRGWSKQHDLSTYQRTCSLIGAAVGGFASHFAVLGAGAMLGSSLGAVVGGPIGAALLGAGGAYLGAKLQGKTMVGRALLASVGAAVGHAVGTVAKPLGVPLRNDMVDTARNFSLDSLNEYSRDMHHSGHPCSTLAETNQLIDKLQPGDIVLTGDERSTPFATATFLLTGRSDFTHAFIYQGDNKTVEARTESGVIEGDLREVLTGKHHAVALRPDYQPGQAQKVVAASREQIGRPYDFKFNSGNEGLYCSEAVEEAVGKGAPQIALQSHDFLGRHLVIPNDLLFTQQAGVVGEIGVARSYLDRLMGKYIPAQ